MESKYFARPGMTEEEFESVQNSMVLFTIDEENHLKELGYKSWNEYILWNISGHRHYEVSDGYFVSYPKKKNNQSVQAVRRDEYYKSYEWRFRSNEILYKFNFICVACGGTADQCHHQAWSKKFGNYLHIGDEDFKELDDLVPICRHCHTVVTNIQNKRRWIKTPRKIDIVLKAYQFPKPVTLFDRMDH